jgi:hypothetical protein
MSASGLARLRVHLLGGIDDACRATISTRMSRYEAWFVRRHPGPQCNRCDLDLMLDWELESDRRVPGSVAVHESR